MAQSLGRIDPSPPGEVSDAEMQVRAHPDFWIAYTNGVTWQANFVALSHPLSFVHAETVEELWTKALLTLIHRRLK